MPKNNPMAYMGMPQMHDYLQPQVNYSNQGPAPMPPGAGVAQEFDYGDDEVLKSILGGGPQPGMGGDIAAGVLGGLLPLGMGMANAFNTKNTHDRLLGVLGGQPAPQIRMPGMVRY